MSQVNKTLKSPLTNEIAVRKGKVPKATTNFEDQVLSRAVSLSKSEEKYSQIMDPIISRTGAIDYLADSIPATIPLTCQLRQTTGDAIEAVMREIFGDKRASRAPGKGRVDVVHAGVDIEVKYARNGFGSLATDSQALRPRTDKWYMYVKGDIGIGSSCDNTVWLMRADKLYDAVYEFRGGDTTSINTHLTDAEGKKIQALAQIRADIQDIETDLRNAIWNKATGGDLPVRSMSLSHRIGLNRVRFDIKFEGLLRAYVKEVLRS